MMMMRLTSLRQTKVCNTNPRQLLGPRSAKVVTVVSEFGLPTQVHPELANGNGACGWLRMLSRPLMQCLLRYFGCGLEYSPGSDGRKNSQWRERLPVVPNPDFLVGRQKYNKSALENGDSRTLIPLRPFSSAVKQIRYGSGHNGRLNPAPKVDSDVLCLKDLKAICLNPDVRARSSH